ncbi:2,3-butanediol dehydrogenase, S-alcohol forming, (R)-acetoin-specific / Acetoin (diacetyl) reductase [Streptococcus macedonicus]|nr:2,3-butanediol dehydrogenase, S-alcohol forming, (R)-acetoin-specific / Acetoin (diacetyl) reductase [Streptococcus macedonicus]
MIEKIDKKICKRYNQVNLKIRGDILVKVAIVTGAGQGIGFAIAKRLHEDGFQVGILDYNQETAEKAVQEISPTDAFAVVADVSKHDEVAKASSISSIS